MPVLHASTHSKRPSSTMSITFGFVMHDQRFPSDVEPPKSKPKLLQVTDYDFELCGPQSPCSDFSAPPVSPSQTFPHSPHILSPETPFTFSRHDSLFEPFAKEIDDWEAQKRPHVDVYGSPFYSSTSSSSSLSSTPSQSVDVLVLSDSYPSSLLSESDMPTPTATSSRWILSPELPELSFGSSLAMSLNLTLSCDNLTSGPQTSFPASPVTSTDTPSTWTLGEPVFIDAAELARLADLPSSPVTTQTDLLAVRLAPNSTDFIAPVPPSPAAQQGSDQFASRVMPYTPRTTPRGNIGQHRSNSTKHLSLPPYHSNLSTDSMQSTPHAELPSTYVPQKASDLGTLAAFDNAIALRIPAPAREPRTVTSASFENSLAPAGGIAAAMMHEEPAMETRMSLPSMGKTMQAYVSATMAGQSMSVVPSAAMVSQSSMSPPMQMEPSTTMASMGMASMEMASTAMAVPPMVSPPHASMRPQMDEHPAQSSMSMSMEPSSMNAASGQMMMSETSGDDPAPSQPMYAPPANTPPAPTAHTQPAATHVVFPAAMHMAAPMHKSEGSQKKRLFTILRKAKAIAGPPSPEAVASPDLTRMTPDPSMMLMSDPMAPEMSMQDDSSAMQAPTEMLHSMAPLARQDSTSSAASSATGKARLLNRLRSQLPGSHSRNPSLQGKRTHSHENTSEEANCPSCRGTGVQNGNPQTPCKSCWDENSKPWRAFLYRLLGKQLPMGTVADDAMVAEVMQAMQMASAEQDATSSSGMMENKAMSPMAPSPFATSPMSRSNLEGAAASMAAAAAKSSSPAHAQMFTEMSQRLSAMALSMVSEEPAPETQMQMSSAQTQPPSMETTMQAYMAATMEGQSTSMGEHDESMDMDLPAKMASMTMASPHHDSTMHPSMSSDMDSSMTAGQRVTSVSIRTSVMSMPGKGMAMDATADSTAPTTARTSALMASEPQWDMVTMPTQDMHHGTTAPVSPYSPKNIDSPVTIEQAPPMFWQPSVPMTRVPAFNTIRSLQSAPSTPPPPPPVHSS